MSSAVLESSVEDRLSKLKITEDGPKDNEAVALATLISRVATKKRTYDQVTKGHEEDVTPSCQKRLKLPKEDSLRESKNEGSEV